MKIKPSELKVVFPVCVSRRVLHADGVCQSVLYGLPLVIRPTSCWQLDWDEIESNHQMFHALCHTLEVSAWLCLSVYCHDLMDCCMSLWRMVDDVLRDSRFIVTQVQLVVKCKPGQLFTVYTLKKYSYQVDLVEKNVKKKMTFSVTLYINLCLSDTWLVPVGAFRVEHRFRFWCIPLLHTSVYGFTLSASETGDDSRTNASLHLASFDGGTPTPCTCHCGGTIT